MTPDKAVALALLIPSGVSVAFIAAAVVTANVRHPKTPAPTRQAAQGPRVGVGTTCHGGCGLPPVVKYAGRNYCQDCADEVAALDQMAVDKEIRAMERHIAAMQRRWGA